LIRNHFRKPIGFGKFNCINNRAAQENLTTAYTLDRAGLSIFDKFVLSFIS
jgi:hypothetical protein